MAAADRPRSQLFERALEFGRRAARARQSGELVRQMAAAIAPHGGTSFGRISLVEPNRSPGIGCFIGTQRPDWMRHYRDQGFFARDLAVRSALRSTAPRMWTDIARAARTRAHREVFEAAAEFGGREGFVAPIHHWRGSVQVVLIAGEVLDTAPDAASFLHLVSIQFNNAIERFELEAMDKAEQALELTERQLECLKWVAAGKTDWEIGEILSLSENTVHRHIERAKQRLNVRTRAQAVMEILQRGSLSQP